MHPFKDQVNSTCQSQWPRGLRRVSAAARLLELWVRTPPGTWVTVSRECCMLSRALCVGTITRPERSYLEWCVSVWWCVLDNENAMAHWRLLLHKKIYLILWSPSNSMSKLHSVFGTCLPQWFMIRYDWTVSLFIVSLIAFGQVSWIFINKKLTLCLCTP